MIKRKFHLNMRSFTASIHHHEQAHSLLDLLLNE